MAATGIKLANRAIQYAGQVAGIGVQGLMETFLPTGASELANNSWFTRIIGGLAGAAPALPNVAGKSPSPVSPTQMAQNPLNPFGTPQQPVAGNEINLTYNNYSPDASEAGLRDMNRHAEQAYALAGQR
jgi:hypothetical protein